jgi:hypothetical protein
MTNVIPLSALALFCAFNAYVLHDLGSSWPAAIGAVAIMTVTAFGFVGWLDRESRID